MLYTKHMIYRLHKLRIHRLGEAIGKIIYLSTGNFIALKGFEALAIFKNALLKWISSKNTCIILHVPIKKSLERLYYVL